MDVFKWVFLLTAMALYCSQTGSTGVPSFVKVGCYRDVTAPAQRALPELLVNFRLPPYANTFPWNNMNKVVQDCAREAAKKNYMYFSLQFYGECWSGVTAPQTYDRHGAAPGGCTTKVGKQGTNFVYRFVGKENECLNYGILDSANRSNAYQLPKGMKASCDSGLASGWYRFMSPAGTRMASTCVQSGKCATVVTGSLASTPPKMTDGIVPGEVCFRWSSECCKWKQAIKVRNCGRFFVYKLDKTFGCPMRFCAVN